MKRSEINAALKEMEAMVKEYRFSLPPFCHFTPEEWQEKGHENAPALSCQMSMLPTADGISQIMVWEILKK